MRLFKIPIAVLGPLAVAARSVLATAAAAARSRHTQTKTANAFGGGE
jgi:hypothetical protein